jgi:dihydropteroate synthase
VLAPLRFRSLTLDWSAPRVMGVVNATPDSFSDGGVYAGVEAAVARALELDQEGADLVDVGGESTRPGAAAVSREEELARVVPVIERLAGRVRAVLSVDTSKAEVARAALAAGAEVVNDVSGGVFDPAMARVVLEAGAVYVCGHLRGQSLAEVHAAAAPSGFEEIAGELAERLAGLPGALRARTIADPGIGFGKGTALNLELLRRAGELATRLQCPVMVGPSRKRFLGDVTGRPVGDRDAATHGAVLAAVSSGAQLVRVHDVAGTCAALRAYLAVRGGGGDGGPAA